MPTLPPAELSRQLRLGQSPDLTRRRWIIGLSMVTAAAGQIVTLYQTGIIPHLPDPPLAVFDSDKVDASDYAYKRLQMPDALAMISRPASRPRWPPPEARTAPASCPGYRWRCSAKP